VCLSRRKRSLPRESSDIKLNDETENGPEIEDEVANISSAMNLIHLTQAVYFQPNPSAIIAEDLMHWVNRLESRPDPAEGNEIMRRQPACQHPGYWGFLHKYHHRNQQLTG
jgi:Nup85 Nucleoporin